MLEWTTHFHGLDAMGTCTNAKMAYPGTRAENLNDVRMFQMD